MATLYESLLPEIIPMVPGCPDTLIENNIRAATIELCEKAAVLQAELDSVTTRVGTFEYDLEPPTDTVVHRIMWMIYDGKDLDPISTSLLEQRKPSWRDAANRGTPEYYIKVSQSLFWIVPVPNVTKVGGVILRAQLKPTQASLSADDELMSDYRDTIVNGALYRLLRLPSKEWTDFAGAQVYGALFNEGIIAADKRARQADVGIARKVSYGGIHSPYSRRRNRYGNGG